ncbi:MAG: hypothetical protein AAF371_06100 [Pseudomonadota bacterium]
MGEPRVARIVRLPAGKAADTITRERWNEFKRNRRQAGNRGNWSDGGHWIGSGPEPNAFDSLEASSAHTLALSWPTDDCVEKFRNQSKEIAERLGYGVAIIAAIATRGRSWGAGLGAGLAGSWLLARSGGIRVHRGWRYEIVSTVAVAVHAHPWSRHLDGMTITKTETLRDHENCLVDRKESSGFREFSGLSDQMLFDLFQSISGTGVGGRTDISCPDASVLIMGN